MEVISILLKIVFVVGFFALCIIIHELGHLLAALWRGLHVERFSIGFGKKLWGFEKNGVEYIVAPIPCGGYVSLPQLEPAEEIVASNGKILPHAKPIDKIIAAFAGPLFNVIFGFFLATFVWYFGIMKEAPSSQFIVGSVPEKSAEYKAGLRVDDVIVELNGKAFDCTWNEFCEKIVLTPKKVALSIKRNGKNEFISYEPDPNPVIDDLGYPFFTVLTPVIIKEAIPGKPAAIAGIQEKDVIKTVNGKTVSSSHDLAEIISNNKNNPIDITLERDGKIVEIPRFYAQLDKLDGKDAYIIGIRFSPLMKLMHPTHFKQFNDFFSRTTKTLKAVSTKDSKVKLKHFSGPLGIVMAIMIKILTGGYMEALSFIIFISFSLAFVNLLPLPVIDGGHITFSFIEIIIKRRIPVRILIWLQTAFAIVLISFMLYVTYQDAKRSKKFYEAYRRKAKTEEKIEEKTEQKIEEKTEQKIELDNKSTDLEVLPTP